MKMFTWCRRGAAVDQWVGIRLQSVQCEVDLWVYNKYKYTKDCAVTRHIDYSLKFTFSTDDPTFNRRRLISKILKTRQNKIYNF